MTDFIEQDALNNTDYQDPPPTPHDHASEVLSFVATPCDIDAGLVQKVWSWLKGGNPNMPIIYKTANGLRRMLLFTSNSYKDRDGETITSKALEDYEAACHPGEDLYHNDNPMLWWHDEDVPMGTIEGVEYIIPFLVEVGQEIPNDPISRVLWDYAEKNGDKAGVSHKFAYLEKDRDKDGVFHQIFKQETSYLPERSLAANGKTYAGVLKPMSIPESRKRLGQILAETTGVSDIEEMLHTEGIPAVRKRLAEEGLQHKAAKPPFPPKPADAPAVVTTDEAVVEADAIEEDDETVVEETGSGKVDLTRLMTLMNGVLNMFGDMLDTQASSEMDRVGMMKSLDELKEARVSEKAAEKVTLEGLMEKLKSLEDRQLETEKRVGLQGKSVTQEKGFTPESIKAVVEAVEKSRADGELEDVPGWGKLKPLPK